MFLLQTIVTLGQEDAWIYFSDKPNSASFLLNPISELSQRSIDRRTAQKIAIDIKDAPVYQAYIDQVSATNGIVVLAKSKWLNALHIRGSIDDIRALATLYFVNDVQFADYALNANNKLLRPQIKNAAAKNLNTNIDFNYGSSNNQISMLSGQLLHQQNFTGLGKIIAVLDAGFPSVNSSQPFARLRDNNKILGGYNYVSRSSDFYTANSHGTLVLSTMGGYAENQLVGTAPDASYYLFVTEDAATENPIEESLWVEAAEEADRLGADIINTSLGYFDYDNPNYSHTYSRMNGVTTFISRGANVAFTRGMVVVVSAGNSGNSSNPNIAAPADAINVLTVGAVDANRTYASFSSRGPSFDARIKPDVMAKGQSATVATVSGRIGTSSGTSFSGPIIAGMVACLWQALPNKTAAEIMQIIKQSSDNFATPNANYGYGIPNFSTAIINNIPNVDPTENQLKIFPNPTSSLINFALTDSQKNSVLTIYNFMGQLMLKKDFSLAKNEINLNNFPSGTYLYNLENNNQRASGKIIKI